MKYCEEYAALLDLFVDGELSPEEMERVREHLETCPGCRAYVDDALAIRAGFPDAEETAVPEGFAESVMERIRASSPASKKGSFRRWMGTAAALAACCALVVLVRTGASGGMGDSPAAVTGAAPSGYDSSVDAGAAGGAEEAGIAPQMEESAQMYAYDAADSAAGNISEAAAGDSAGKTEDYAGEQQRNMPAAAAAPKVKTAAQSEAAAEDMALCLTAQEAGDLLDGFIPEEESDSERRYTLNQEEYEALLEALGLLEKLPDTPDMRFQVVVTGPFK